MRGLQRERLESLLATKKTEYPVVILFFLLMAIVFTWPLILHFHDGVIGGYGDPMLNSWIINWDARTIFTHPSGLFQGNIMFPARDVLAYSEHLFVLGLLSAPVYYITHSPIASYNFMVFFGFVLSGFGCYLLIKELTGSRWAGLAGGVFFALCPYKISKLSQMQNMFSPFMPFMLLYLYRFLKGGGKGNLALFGVFFLAQSLSSWHYMIFCALAAGLMWLWTAVFSRSRTDWVRLAWVVAALAIAVLLIIPFALPYLRAHSRLPGFERNLEEIKGYGAGWEDYLTVLNVSVVYGDAPSPFRKGAIGYENVLYPGVIIVVLALAGLFLRRREEDFLPSFSPYSYRRGALYFLILAAAGFLLSLGPEVRGISNPLYTIPYDLGILKFIRVPTRFFILLALGLAVLGGYGLAKISMRLADRARGKGVLGLVPVALLLLVVFDILTFNINVYPVPVGDEVPEVYRWLDEQGEVRIIELPTSPLKGAMRYDRDLELVPYDVDEYNTREGMLVYYSTYHMKETANGYSGYFPYSYNRIFTEIQGFPSQRSLELLRGLGIDYVIWDWNWVPTQRQEEYNVRLFSTPGLAFVEDFGEKSVFMVEPGETCEAEELEVDAVLPDTILPERGFNAGLLVRNTSDLPYVRYEEDPQPFRLRFLDAGGGSVLEVEGEYRAPFFLQAGEEASLPMRVEQAPAVGSYDVELLLGEGVLGPRDFTLEVEAAEMPDSRDPGRLDGQLAWEGEEVRIPAPDGLFPMEFEVTNTGDTYWIAYGSDRHAEENDPVGLVNLVIRWEQDGVPTWEEQRGTLPCDVAPGQTAPVPTLIRPPPTPGVYTLIVRIGDEGERLFGRALEIEVDVEGWIEGQPGMEVLEEAA